MSTEEINFPSCQSKDFQIHALNELLKNQEEKLKFVEQENHWLREQIKTFSREKFGKKSERWESPEQLVMVFNEAESEAKKAEEPPSTEEPTPTSVTSHQRKARGHRRALPAHLPREVVKIELPESELITESGESLQVIGWEVSEKLKYEPAQVSVIEYHRAKYGVSVGDYQKTAPPLPSVIPKGIATPELLAAIITGKYADGLTLYRLEEIFTRQNIELSRGTMARWMVQVAESLVPIFNVLSDRLFESYAIACDETFLQVLKEPERSPELKSWMIVRLNPVEKKKIVLFDYSISRSGKTMKNLFSGYQGKLLCDGLGSYSPLESKDLIRYGCNMHSRRKFKEAATDGANSGKTIASQVMNLYGKIYNHEEEIANAPPDQKMCARQEKQKPLFEEIQLIIYDYRDKVPYKSKLGRAFTYFLNEYEYLTRYLDDGHMGPDNGEVERVIRKYAIGRNNWLFADTSAGAEASSLLYTFVITAKVNGANPYTALTKILTEIPLAKTIEDYERLAEVILTPQ